MGKVPVVTQRPDRTSVFAQYTVFVENREQVQEKLKADGIPTAVHYPVPLHMQPAYSALCRISGSLRESEARAQQVMSLPMSADLSGGEQTRISDAILRVCG